MSEVDIEAQPTISAMDLLQKRKSRTMDVENDQGPTEEHMTYDLGRLAAFYSSPSEKFDLTNHQQMLEKATNTVQFLVGRFFALPSEPVEGGRLVELPAAVTQLPREKPVPKPRAPTRWEKFAKEKGIQKKKKDLMVYDEQSKEWKPRFGYKRKENETDALPPIVEAGPGDDGSENPWEKKDRERKDRSSKQKSRERRNVEERGDAPVHLAPADAPRAEQKAAAEAALAMARRATASVGKFDAKLRGEKPKAIKRKLAPEEATGRSEKTRNLEVLSRIVSLDSASLDLDKAAGRVSSFMPEEGRSKRGRDKRGGDKKGRDKKGRDKKGKGKGA